MFSDCLFPGCERDGTVAVDGIGLICHVKFGRFCYVSELEIGQMQVQAYDQVLSYLFTKSHEGGDGLSYIEDVLLEVVWHGDLQVR